MGLQASILTLRTYELTDPIWDELFSTEPDRSILAQKQIPFLTSLIILLRKLEPDTLKKALFVLHGRLKGRYVMLEYETRIELIIQLGKLLISSQHQNLTLEIVRIMFVRTESQDQPNQLIMDIVAFIHEKRQALNTNLVRGYEGLAEITAIIHQHLSYQVRPSCSSIKLIQLHSLSLDFLAPFCGTLANIRMLKHLTKFYKDRNFQSFVFQSLKSGPERMTLAKQIINKSTLAIEESNPIIMMTMLDQTNYSSSKTNIIITSQQDFKLFIESIRLPTLCAYIFDPYFHIQLPADTKPYHLLGSLDSLSFDNITTGFYRFSKFFVIGLSNRRDQNLMESKNVNKAIGKLELVIKCLSQEKSIKCEQGLHMKEQIFQQLGISKRTYYRHLKWVQEMKIKGHKLIARVAEEMKYGAKGEDMVQDDLSDIEIQ